MGNSSTSPCWIEAQLTKSPKRSLQPMQHTWPHGLSMYTSSSRLTAAAVAPSPNSRLSRPGRSCWICLYSLSALSSCVLMDATAWGVEQYNDEQHTSYDQKQCSYQVNNCIIDSGEKDWQFCTSYIYVHQFTVHIDLAKCFICHV